MRPHFTVLVLSVVGCGSAHLKASQHYVAAGNAPVAIEILHAGLAAEPSNEEIRDALVLAQQSHQYELREDIDRLSEVRRFTLALGRLTLLEETSRSGAEHKIPGEDIADLESERRKVIRSASTQLQRSLDDRAGRGQDDSADLGSCRILFALQPGNAEVARTCDRLRSRFRLLAVLEPADGAARTTQSLLPAVHARVVDRNPELLQIVGRDSGKHNAAMKVFVGEPVVEESEWRMVKRDAFSLWIPKRNKSGVQLEETLTEKPNKKAREKAKKAGKPPPKAKKIKKKVWLQVQGEYRHYRQARTVTVPYRVVIEDLRGNTVAVSLVGTHSEMSDSRYHEYSGHAKAKSHNRPKSPAGKGRAARTKSAAQLLQDVINALPAKMVGATLKRVE